ncbi:DUF3306 domain-containing protein [Sagittula sp. SSi028]|uniref:DUF3306 domain-containing protein n=1 Tax=Sagittula sp. SSi028 TaxID=3400636 RepID=UPI003AF450A4
MSGGFWERRKAAVAEEQLQEAQAAEDARLAEAEQALAERDDAELLAEAGLRDPDEMDSPEEVQALLRTALPQRLKTRALRRLWRLNPVLANLDGLVEYGEDYTDAALVVEGMQTVYQVGKGMFDKAAEAARAAEAKAEQASCEPATDEDLPEPPTQMTADAAQTIDAEETPLSDTPQDDEPPMPSGARRMRFRFEDTEGRA